MSLTLALAVALGGAIGAPLRYLIDSRVTQATAAGKHRDFPWGLLIVNAVGSLTIGIAYASIDGHWRAVVATGACGALTTYSGYALFLNRVWTSNRTAAWRAVIAMPVVCISACALGVLVTRSIGGS